MPVVRTLDEVVAVLRSPYALEALAGDDAPILFVRGRSAAVGADTHAALSALPLVTVLLQPDHSLRDETLAAFDVVLEVDSEDHVDDVAGRVEAKVARNPMASVALVQLLRTSENLSIVQGLWAESTTYSMLQAGPEFRAWLRTRGRHRKRSAPASDTPPLGVDRDGAELVLTFCRPEVHNAFGFEVRDALVEALQLATADESIESVVLRGEGPSFCSGGDLREFGTTPDPATAHVVRSLRSAAFWLAANRRRLRAEIHGACVGSGIELAAYASHVTAAEGTTIKLPEISMGLVPGAGGTVSLPRRIGRHKSAYLALAGVGIDAATALEWGLVDEISRPARAGRG